MPTPSTSLATLRPDLAGSLQEFDLAMSRMGFIANRVMPVIEVAAAAGTFGKIPLEQLLQNRDTVRAPGSGYNRGDWTFTTASYACVENGWEEPVDDRARRMYASYFDAEMISTQRAFDFVLRGQERRVANLLFNATTYATASLTTGVANEWDDYANATPVEDVEAAVRKIWDGTGLWPNALIINATVFRNLRLCEQVKEAIQSAGAGSATKAADITAQLLAQVFGLEQVIVAGAAQNTSAGATAAISNVWSNEYAMVARVGSGPDIQEPCVGKILHWADDGSQIGGTVETYRDENVRSDVVRVRHDVDEVVLYTEAAHLLSNITT